MIKFNLTQADGEKPEVHMAGSDKKITHTIAVAISNGIMARYIAQMATALELANRVKDENEQHQADVAEIDSSQFIIYVDANIKPSAALESCAKELGYTIQTRIPQAQ